MPAPRVSLREESNQFNIHMQQLTVPYLIKGYYPRHSLIVACASLAVSAALTCLPAAASSSSSPLPTDMSISPARPCAAQTQGPAHILLFTTFTSFAASVVVAVMTLTALYRLLVDTNRNASTQVCGAAQQAEFLVDTLLKGTVDATAQTLWEGSTAARAALIGGVSVVAELGKLCGSTPLVLTLLSALWVGYLIVAHSLLPEKFRASLARFSPAHQH